MSSMDTASKCPDLSSCHMYDAIVVGAGIMGSSTAYYLQKKGMKVLLLEQFPLSHTRGSSHGSVRAIQSSSYVKPLPTAHAAMKMWQELEHEMNTELYQQTGALVYGQRLDVLDKMERLSKSINEPTSGIMNSRQLASKYPLMNFHEDSIGCHQQAAGILHADKARSAFQRLFLQRGGHIKDNEKVVQIVPGEIVHVITDKEKYKTRSLALCCGGWATQLLPTLDIHIPLQCEAIDVCYWTVKSGISHVSMPTFLGLQADDVAVFGFPAIEYPGMMKICAHSGVNCSPDTRDDVDQQRRQSIMDSTRAFVSHTFPYLDASQPAIVERCMYTTTPDKLCVVDRHEDFPNIVYAAGFSGMGFKMAPVIGCILTDFLTNETPRFHEPQFAYKRFHPSAKL